VLDRRALDDVLDSALVCHLAVMVDGVPLVIPTVYGWQGDTLYIHRSTGAGTYRASVAGEPVCVTITVLDAVIYARSAFHHSVNYRSAIIHGRLRTVTDPEEQLVGLQAIVEHVAPGSWAVARPPSAKERAATAVVALDLTEASVKVRAADPGDEPEDIAADLIWAGVLPIEQSWGAAQPAADLLTARPVPTHVTSRSRPGVAHRAGTPLL